MWARLESNTIVEILRRPKALNIGGTQYPSNIFSMWSNSELATIGIVPVTIDDTNLKNNEYYINTDITYAYDTETGVATGTYGTATAIAIADTLYTAQDETDNTGSTHSITWANLTSGKISLGSDAVDFASEINDSPYAVVYINRIMARPNEVTITSTGLTFASDVLAEDDEVEVVYLDEQ